MDLHIRPETAADTDRTYEVVASAFGQRLEADLVNALRRSADPQLSLVAELRGTVVAHVFFSPVAIESPRPAPPTAQLAPVAVLPGHQRQGIGTALIRRGLSDCRALGWSAVLLVGDPAYYSRLGFQLAGPFGISYPGPADPYLQVLELEPAALAGVRGPIRLHPAFAQVGGG